MPSAATSVDALPLFLTVEETATLLRKGRTATYAAIERGQIPSVRAPVWAVRPPGLAWLYHVYSPTQRSVGRVDFREPAPPATAARLRAEGR